MADPRTAPQDDRRDRLAQGLARLRNPELRPVEAPPEPPRVPRRRRLWPAVAVAAGAAAVIVAGWLAFAPGSHAPPPAPPPESVPAVPAAPRDFILGGYLRAHREIHVGSPVSGVVARLLARPGARLKAGEVIAELASETLKAQVAAARAAVASAEARLTELRTGARPEEVVRAGAQLAELEAQWAQARRQLERQANLAAEGLVARTSLEEAEQGAAVLEARVTAARQDVELLRQGTRPERILQAEAELDQARATLALAQAQVEQTVIRSPIDGVVTQQHAEVGELVSAGFGGGASAALVTIADVAELVVEIDVPHAELPRIRLGQPVRVESEALGGREYSGHVSWIGPEANRQKLSVPIEVALTGDTEGLLPGLSAKVTFARDPGAVAKPAAPAVAGGDRDQEGGRER